MILLLYVCVSCSKNSETPVDELEYLYGKYRLTELITNTPSTLDDSGNSYNLIQLLPCLTYNIELMSEGIAKENRPQLLLTADTNTRLAIFNCGPALEDILSWRISGENLILDGITYSIQGDDLIYESDPDIYEFHRIVYKKL
ncbi:hypothetical protein [Muriicola sp.]|uniref:hypothetical protein n=1 Tax=Muriicola sp. TaxID=2020856 RepID=UPI003C72641B